MSYQKPTLNLMRFWQSSWKLMLGSLLISTGMGIPLVGQAQSPGDVIQIGDSPSDWSYYQGYWQQLVNLGGATAPPTPSAPAGDAAATATDPAVLEQQLLRNIRVSNVRLTPIIRLNGSSQLIGSITNRNSKPVTVSSINLEIVRGGQMIQTVSAVPEPATLAPGATVTFQRMLNTIPPDGGYQARLARTSPVMLQGGI